MKLEFEDIIPITGLDTEPLRIHIESINTAFEKDDPSLAIGSTKELIEATLKIILDGCSFEYDNRDDIPKLLKKVQKVLKFVPDDVHDSKKGAEKIKQVLSNLSSVVVGTAELRNHYGSGHGRGQKLQGITFRHAKLVVSFGTALCSFLLETYEHIENVNLAHLKSKSWQHLHTLAFTPPSRVRCIGIDPSRQLLASGGEDHIVRIWKLDTGELLSQHKRYYHKQSSGDVNYLTFSHDGKFIISTGFVSSARQHEKQTKIQVLNWETGEVVAHLPPFSRFESSCSIALCPGQDVIAFDSANKIELYNFHENWYLKTLKGHSSQVNTIAFSPNSEILASGSKDGQVKIWDWEADSSLEICFNSLTAINTVAISYDNQFLAIGNDNSSIVLFNLITN